MATITVTDLATELGTDGRTARKFLRSITPKDEQPGKGSRWSIEKRDVRSLKSQYAKFTAAQAQAKLDREATAEAPEGDAEPTAEDLAMIDDED